MTSANGLIGRKWGTAKTRALAERCSYRLVEGRHGDVRVRLRDHVYSIPELGAYILREMKLLAEQFVGAPVDRAVITVPAHFNDNQRHATKLAAELAGLKVERLINEPTAAAIAYGLHEKQEGLFLILDLGGGTFDVSLLEFFDGIMEVRSSAGDAFLGGEDFTDVIMAHFGEQLGGGFAKLKDTKLGLLRDLADKAKLQLSTAHEASVKFNGPKEQHTLTITRAEFEKISEKLVQRLRQPISRAIMDAGMRAENIDRVVLVGGAARMPVIRAVVTRLLKVFHLVQY